MVSSADDTQGDDPPERDPGGDGPLRLPSRLHQHVRARGRAHRRPHHRPRARLACATRTRAASSARRSRATPSAPTIRIGSCTRCGASAPRAPGGSSASSWDEALDIVARDFTSKAARHGPETVWPYYYAGTMGLVQRDGINRLRHAMRYSRWFSTICVTLSDTGWIAGTGMKRGVDLREIDEHSDLVVIWGGNPVNTQVNVMNHAMAAKRRGRHAGRRRSLPHRHRGAGRSAPGVAARHRRRAGLRGDARALRGGLRRLGLSAPLHRLPGRAGPRTWRRGRPSGRRRSPASPPTQITGFARLYGRTKKQLHPLPPRLQPLAQRRRQHARGELPARGDRRLAATRAAARSTAIPRSTRSTAR